MDQMHIDFFRAMFSSPSRADGLIREFLPPEVAKYIDPNHPAELDPETFIEQDAHKTRCDVLLKVRLTTGQNAMILALLEHQASEIDLPVQIEILRCIASIWLRELESRTPTPETLPAVIPMVIYAGSQPWKRSQKPIPDLIEAPIELRRMIQGFAFAVPQILNVPFNRT